ncbi:MAG: response regulator transcription factor [Anaerolineae bacterium]|nr:response regulator transcription factor [Anaerolineae bacterium]
MAQDRLRILAIDDDAEFLGIIERMLLRNGYEVIKALSGAEGLRLAYSMQPHAILLDVMMPSYDGFEVCKRLREMTDTCIIFITAKGRTEDIVRGLSLGADDYITKPFRMEELASRLSACLRRTSGVQASRVPVALGDGDSLILDKSRRQVVVRGNAVHLTQKEFELLEYLVQHAGRVLPKDAILSQIWGAEYIGDTDLLKQFIYRLRRKLEIDPRKPKYIQTVRGVGYSFESMG